MRESESDRESKQTLDAAMQTTRERHLLQQQQQRNNNNNNSPHVWQQRQWLLLASVLMLTLFTRTIQGITEELSPGKCGRL